MRYLATLLLSLFVVGTLATPALAGSADAQTEIAQVKKKVKKTAKKTAKKATKKAKKKAKKKVKKAVKK